MGTPNKFFGAKVFIILALRYQGQAVQSGDERTGTMNTRVSSSGALYNICGPYAQLLQRVLEEITKIDTEGLQQVSVDIIIAMPPSLDKSTDMYYNYLEYLKK